MESSLFDTLLRNFQEGLGVRQLQEELQQSTASMNKSREVIYKEMADRPHR
jgi:hypothetical protein